MAISRNAILRGLNAFNRHSRLYSNPPPSTYYIQTFPHTTEQFVLLLPEISTPMGRIHLSVPPPTPPPSGRGPAANFIGPISPEDLKRDWGTFIENGGFRGILQKVVAENISGEQVVMNDARSLPTGEGWVHLCDERALPAFGRIPEPEDIIGSVLVKEGEILPGTYQAAPTYRLMTREGPMKLSEFLLEKLREKLKKD